MTLDKISASIKPRNGWQSIDLGIQMVRAWWKPLFSAWFILTFPIFLLVHGLSIFSQTLPMLVFWWLKPLFESMLLYYFSHALFGEFLSVKQLMRNFWPQGKIQMLSYLTFRRLSPHRSFTMPVSQLEKLEGKHRNRRIILLLNQVSSQSIGLITFFVHLELFLYLSFYGMLLFFKPINPGGSFFSTGALYASLDAMNSIFSDFFLYLSIGLVAPFYVGAGFSLYVNRRASLEGWDIELVFRQIVSRIKRKQDPEKLLSERFVGGQFKKVVCILFGLLSGIILVQEKGLAQSSDVFLDKNLEKTVHDPGTAKKIIKDILADESFHQKKTITKYKFMDDLFKFDQDTQVDNEFFKYINSILIWIARSIKLILYVFFIMLILLAAYKYRKWIGSFVTMPEKVATDQLDIPDTLFGLDVRKESLPENIPEKVLSLWLEGDSRQALSLLYRGSLSRLISVYALPFSDSYTEQECLNLVCAKATIPLREYFENITRQWQELAYGHHLPQTDTVKDLCNKWRQFFEVDEKT